MFIPKLKLVNIGDKLTYVDENDVVYKEEILENNKNCYYTPTEVKEKENVTFDNAPLSGWHISMAFRVQIGSKYRDKCYVLKHPTLNVEFCIDFFKLEKAFNNLIIEKGVIKNKIIILNDGYEVTIDVEGSDTFEKNVSFMDIVNNNLNKIQKRNLKIGNKVFLKNKYNAKELMFLGTSYMKIYSFEKDSNDIGVQSGIRLSKKADKFYIFTGKTAKHNIIFGIKDTSVKDITLLSDEESNIKYTEILKSKIDKEYYGLEKFLGLRVSTYKHKEYNRMIILSDDKNDKAFNDMQSLKRYFFKYHEEDSLLPNVFNNEEAPTELIEYGFMNISSSIILLSSDS